MLRRPPAITWALLLFAAACAAPRSEIAAAPPAPRPVIVAAPPAPTVSAAPAPPADPKDKPAPPEIMAKLTAEQREELDELGPICQTAVFIEGEALAVGCWGSRDPAPDRRPIMAAPDAERVAPSARLRGSFTEKGADERLLVMKAFDFPQSLDHAYVLRADASGALAVRVHASVRGYGGCKLVRRRGQVDRALCSHYWARMGAETDSLELYDFTRPVASPGDELSAVFELTASDDLRVRCTPGAAFVRRSRTTWALRDIDGDGEDDLIVGLAISDGVVTEAMAASECVDSVAPRRSRKVELRWTAAPEGFKPTAQTAAELERLDKAAKRDEL